MTDDRMSFISHLEELRFRLVRALIAVGVGFGICYAFADRVFAILAHPVRGALPEGSSLAMLSVSEGFFTYLKISFFAGLLLASPVVIYQIWAFVAPGLYAKEKRLVFPFFIFSTVLFLSGVAFSYFIVFPFGYRFLLGYAKGDIVASLSIGWYVSFATKLLLAFGVVFQLPLVLFFLNRAGIVGIDALRRNRKYALLAAFLVGAILTPPDVVTQTFLAIPLFILYELSIWLIKFLGKKEPPEEPEETGPSEGGDEGGTPGETGTTAAPPSPAG